MIYLKKNWAFTLVELIVVITILAILWTIGFVSMQWFSGNARESSRISDITSMQRMLEYYKLKNWTFPLPDSPTSISASGTLIGYQGYAGRNLLNTIWFSADGKDPLDGSYYTYYMLDGKSHIQILSLIEKPFSSDFELTQKAYSATTQTRYPKVYGNKLWVITDLNNIPLQSLSGTGTVDIIQTNSSYIAHVSDSVTYTGSGSNLRYSIPKSSCQRLADINLGWPSGYYTISPIGKSSVEVYCDFSVEGEGLTLIARSVNNVIYNATPFGWFISRGNPRDDTQPFSLGTSVQGIPFQKVYLTVYSSDKIVTGKTTLDVVDINIFNGSYGATSINVNGCVGADIGGGTSSCTLFNKWWKFNSTVSYWFSNNASNTTDGLNPRRYGATFPVAGMIFVK